MPKSHPGTSYGTLGMEQARGYFQSPTPGSLNLPPHGLDPSLVFTLSKSYIGVGETIDIVAVSQSEPSSEGVVTYKLIAGPATLDGATLTSSGKGAIELRASIEAAGDYVVTLEDALMGGASGHRYRLRVGDFPLISVPHPAVVQNGVATSLGFSGIAISL